MATKDKQADVEIHLRSDRKATEPTNLPEDVQYPIIIKDDPEIENLYKASEANSYLNDQLLEQDEITGEIRSQVENVVPDGDFDPEKPVMPRSQLRTINTLESLIPEEEHQALIEAGTMGADFFDSTVNIIGGSLEDAAHNSLKYFYSLTPDSFQESFKQSMFGQEGGVAGITGTEEQFEQTRMFPHMGGIGEEMARSMGSFAWGMKGSGIVLNTKKAMVLRGAISDMTVFNPDHGNLAHVIREMDWGPEVLQNLARYIDSTEPGTATEKRARMAAEGILLTMAISGAMKSPQAMRELNEWRKTFFGENGTGRPAVDAVTKLLSEMKNKWNKKFNFGKYLDDHNPGWRSTGGGAPTEAESAARTKKKTKVKKKTKTEETGTLNTIYPEVNQAMEEQMGRMDPVETELLRKNMTEHEFTPWAAATSRGLTIREFFDRAIEGRVEEALALANSKLWGKDSLVKYAMGKAFMHSEEAVLKFAESYSFIGFNRKAELDISGAFKNCNPSKDCAKFCYAAIANARPTELMKAEFTEWIGENYPEIYAKHVIGLYNDTPQGRAGLALRINDKGDLSDAQVEMIKAMNKAGHRIQIFSKRPDMLAKVPDENLKMMSIDSSNFEMTRQHPEYQLAVTITDDMTPEMIAEINDRVAVYLPVNMKGGEVTRADVQQRFPETFKKMTKKLCPVDGGKMKTKPGTSFVNIVTKTAEPGLWTCTACDKFGAAGCFYGKNQTENVKKIKNQIKQVNK